ncbi:hypothetical protein PSACC_02894 [Paramicrosporidium saccamoebae]|uniref:Uncharacterized protein n=1 Tax=Paramicrosporidium saccamoebae TaxID=1246581 RepID=A0A2H9THT0_9FUNG|nr:hypothetical protein PSACC_02894 [Paramicrosporidium saccamoebae]
MVSVEATETSVAPDTGVSAGLVGRLSEYALVTSTLDHLSRVYASGKDSSRLVQMGASTVEYSMRLVTETFEPQLKTIDGYAGRQLERLENAYVPTAEMRRKMEGTLQGLNNAETYIDFLLGRLRNAVAGAQEGVSERLETWSESVQAREVQAMARVQHLREVVAKEVVQTLRNVVDLVNNNGYVLPLPGQQALKTFLLSLPGRFTEEGELGQNSRIVLLANEAVVVIKSLANVLTRYILWAGKQSTDDPDN